MSLSYEGNEVDFAATIKVLFDCKWKILSASLAVSVVAFMILITVPSTYRAEIVLSPRIMESQSGLASLAQQYSGLVGLAGLSLNMNQQDDATLALEVLKSRKFLSEFVEKHDLLVPLMASKSWDSDSGLIRIDDDLYSVELGEWVRDVDPPRTKKPSVIEVHEEFLERLTIWRDNETGFVRLSFEHHSPILAAQWLQLLVDELNLTLLSQNVTEANQAIEYLRRQAEETALAELRGLFYELIKEQTKTLMLANVSPDYVFRTIDPPVVPEESYRPNRLQATVMLGVLTLFLSCVLVLLRARILAGRNSIQN